MPDTLLRTKLFIPPLRPDLVSRPRLLAHLNQGLQPGRKLILVSAPAGFGKTTLVGEWVQQQEEGRGKREEDGGTQPSIFTLQPYRVAWLSLEEGDKEPVRFLAYLVAALQTVETTLGEQVLVALRSPQPPPVEQLLAALVNEISALREKVVLVLDDYHLPDARPVDEVLTYLLAHLPPQMHLVIVTREDPNLPLARLRARGQLTEVRVADLRFTPAEAAEFLNRAMDLALSAEQIAALEARTEGWIAGLQLAALSLRERQGTDAFIESFTGSHHFVLDYLLEEVLQQQPAAVQAFLLRTSILDRLCGPLCDAVMGKEEGRRQREEGRDEEQGAAVTFEPSELMLEELERVNLFLIPLDNERRWYRYHHLFGSFLRQRLQKRQGAAAAGYHLRASQWFEENGLALEAFRHAAAANDVARAERLIGAEGMPLHLRGAVAEIVAWLDALPEVVRNARPSLWVRQATLSLVIGQTGGVEEMLVAAESALKERRPGHDLEGVADPQIRDLLGVMATARSTLALTRYRVEEMIAQAQRALAYLHPANLSFRATAHWILGNAYEQVGDRPATATAFTEAIALSQASGDSFTTILAMIGLGQVQQADNRLHQAADTYRRVLAMTGEQPLQIIYEGHLGLARILYQWNDLEAAERHGTESARLARQYEAVIDRFVVCELFLAHLALARGAVAEAATMMAEAEQIVRRHDFVHRLAEVAAARLPVLLRRGDLEAAGRLADKYELALGRARVALARGDTTIALALLPARRREMEAKGWEDERLKAMVLQAVAHHLHGDEEGALERLAEALALAEPSGFIRLFVDEGLPMAQLLQVALRHNIAPAYVRRLLAAFPTGDPAPSPPPAPHSLIEPLTEREREVLHLIAQGLSNREIGERLFIALSTVKGHNRRIYAKLQVQRRTEAVARARALGML